MASVLRGPAEPGKDQAYMEDEDDLFEIDLEAVSSMPPTQYYWESKVTATRNALLANCLLPISYLSSAVPMVSTACNTISLVGTGQVVMIMEPMPLGKLLSLSSFGAFGVQQKATKA